MSSRNIFPNHIKIDLEKEIVELIDYRNGRSYWRFSLSKYGNLQLFRSDGASWCPDTNNANWKKVESVVIEHFNEKAEQILLTE